MALGLASLHVRSEIQWERDQLGREGWDLNTCNAVSSNIEGFMWVVIECFLHERNERDVKVLWLELFFSEAVRQLLPCRITRITTRTGRLSPPSGIGSRKKESRPSVASTPVFSPRRSETRVSKRGERVPLWLITYNSSFIETESWSHISLAVDENEEEEEEEEDALVSLPKSFSVHAKETEEWERPFCAPSLGAVTPPTMSWPVKMLRAPLLLLARPILSTGNSEVAPRCTHALIFYSGVLLVWHRTSIDSRTFLPTGADDATARRTRAQSAPPEISLFLLC